MIVNEFLSDRRRSATGTIDLVEVLDSGGGRPTPASPTSIQLGLKVVRPAFQGTDLGLAVDVVPLLRLQRGDLLPECEHVIAYVLISRVGRRMQRREESVVGREVVVEAVESGMSVSVVLQD